MAASSIEMSLTERDINHDHDHDHDHDYGENEAETPDVHHLSLFQCLVKLASFELAFKRPWLEQFACEPKETLRLRANCAASSHSSARLLLDWLFAASTVRLARLGPETPLNQLQVGLSHARPSKRPAVSWRCASTGLMALSLLFIGYSSIYIIITNYVVLQHDIMLTSLQASQPLQPNHQLESVQSRRSARHLNQTAIRMAADCAPKRLIQREPNFDERRFIELNEWLDRLGLEVRSQLGLTFLSMAILCSVPLIFYILPLLFVLTCGHHIRLDALAFLYEPVRERCRLEREQSQILAEMMLHFEGTGNESGRPFGSPLMEAHHSNTAASEILLEKFTRKPQEHRLCARTRCLEQQRRRLISSPKHPANQQHLALLVQIRDQPSERVRPIVVNSEWHFIKQRCTSIIIVVFLLFSLLTPVLSLMISRLIELYVRVGERLRALNCTRWHPEAILIRPALYLSERLFLEEEERRAYELYDGSWRALWRLMFTFELSRMASFRVASYSLKIFLIMFYLALWATIWTAVYLFSFLDKLAWLVQIKCQLKWCTRASQKLAQSVRPKCSSESNLAPTFPVPTPQQARERLLRRLTIVLINYELYRRQHGPFRALTNSLLLQASLFTGACYLILYLVVTNIETKYQLFSAYASACVISYFNFYLVFASYCSKLIENIMHELIRMLAALAREPELIVQPVVNIWRRHLLSEQELRLFTSMRLFTIFISYKQLVAINAHLLGIWLLLFRVLGSPPPVGRAQIGAITRQAG